MRLYQPPSHLLSNNLESAVLSQVCRRQHVEQLKHELLDACKNASAGFTWLRLHGLQRLSAVFLTGLQDPPALKTALDQSYSQVLEVVLSTLDRPLVPKPAADAASMPSSEPQASPASSSTPAGYAPQHSLHEEWHQAFVVLQALCLFQPRTRQLMGSAQYLQVLTAHACASPICLPTFMDLLLSILVGAEEAQALFVSTGGLDTLLRTVLLQAERMQALEFASSDVETPARGGSSGRDRVLQGSAEPAEALVLHLLVFLQVLLGWVIGEAVRKGAHPNTQKAAVQLLQQHLGAAAAAKITTGLSQLVARNPDLAELASIERQGGQLASSSRSMGSGVVERDARSLRGRALEALSLLSTRRPQG